MNMDQDRHYKKRLYLAMGLFFAVFFTIDLIRLYGWGYDLIDMGNFLHFISNTSEGNWWKTSINYPFSPETHRFGIHFSLLSVVFAVPFYWLIPEPETIVFLQVAIMTSTALPTYLCCRTITKSPKLSFYWTLSLLLNPVFAYTTMFSYQDHTLATPLIAWATYGVLNKNFRLLVICCLFLSVAKEHFGASIFGLGLMWCYFHKDYKRGAAIAIFGLTALFVILTIIMPSFSITQDHYMFSGTGVPEKLSYNRYGWVKLPFPDNITHVFSQLFSGQNFTYYAWLFVPFLILPLGSFIMLFPAAADLAASALSDDYISKAIMLYHSSAVPAVLTIAACYTVHKKIKPEIGKTITYLLPPINGAITLYTILPMLVLNIMLMTDENSTIARSDRFYKFREFIDDDKKIIFDQGIFGPWISNRRNISKHFPKDTNANTAVFRLTWNFFSINDQPYRNIPLKNLIALVDKPNWNVTYWDGPYLVLEKDKPSIVPREHIVGKINRLLESQKHLISLSKAQNHGDIKEYKLDYEH